VGSRKKAQHGFCAWLAAVALSLQLEQAFLSDAKAKRSSFQKQAKQYTYDQP
jgi:hypothetical protein